MPDTQRPDIQRTDREGEIARFLAAHGWAGADRRLLAGDASFRRYDRLAANGRRAVLMDAPPPKENVRPWMAVDRLLGDLGYSVPKILAADAEAGLLLIEDLGDDTYTRLLARGADETALYRLAVDLLIDLHRRFPSAGRTELPPHDDARALREVGLLLDWYWPATQGGEAPAAVRDAYLAAWRTVLPARRRVADSFAFFDFHVDNLLWLPEREGVAACGLLDFQDAVLAPLPFDLMSLIEDARRDVPPALGAELRARYLAAFPDLDPEDFAAAFAVVGAQRHSRILGTFTRLLVRDGKSGYLVHMPRVWRQLEGNLAHPVLAPVRDWFAAHLPPAMRLQPKA